MASVPRSHRPLRKAVLPVAGFGTRVLPATKVIPKELLPVFDKPAIQYVVDEALAAGIEHIVFVTGRNKGAIEDYFDRAYELEVTLETKKKETELNEVRSPIRAAGSMSFVRQQAALGLGHAVWCARDIIGDEPFAVMLPDMLMMAQPGCLKQMVDAYNKVGGNLIAVEPTDTPERYGVITPESRDGRLIKMKGMVEKPKREDAPSNLFISGRYILQPEIFALLESQGPGAGNEIQLTDSMARLMGSQTFHAYEYEGRTYDCGDKIGYLQAFAAYALANQQHGANAAATLKALLADKGLMLQITEFATRDALMQATAERIADTLIQAIAERGHGCAALSGGSTPEPTYRALAEIPMDWDQITFALVDERFVPPSHEASNERMIETALTFAFRRGAQFKPMFSATESVEQAADQADAIYKDLRIDIALMGMGADGHTASWFPGVEREALQSERGVIAVHAPQAAGTAERLTLTRNALARAGRLLLLITGADKRARLEQAVADTADAPVAALFAPGMPPIEVFWAA